MFFFSSSASSSSSLYAIQKQSILLFWCHHHHHHLFSNANAKTNVSLRHWLCITYNRLLTISSRDPLHSYLLLLLLFQYETKKKKQTSRFFCVGEQIGTFFFCFCSRFISFRFFTTLTHTHTLAIKEVDGWRWSSFIIIIVEPLKKNEKTS